MRNNSYRTPTERWQKTSDFPTAKKHPTCLVGQKKKEKNRDKRIGMGLAFLRGSCEGGNVSTYYEASSLAEMGWEGRWQVGSFRAMEQSTAAGVQRAKWSDSCTEDWC